MKIVRNDCYGGFSVSQAVYKRLGIPWDGYGYISNEDLGITGDHHAYRTDERLISVVEELGKDANGRCADLEVIEIPDDVDWFISDYDGIETIHEKHRSW
jgi:hypothetical protein